MSNKLLSQLLEVSTGVVSLSAMTKMQPQRTFFCFFFFLKTFLAAPKAAEGGGCNFLVLLKSPLGEGDKDGNNNSNNDPFGD